MYTGWAWNTAQNGNSKIVPYHEQTWLVLSVWKAKILETNLENNLEGINSTVPGQGQTLKYLTDFG